jgi:hypothetical protein
MTDLELNVAVAEFLGVTIRTDPRTGAQWVDVDGGPFRPATSLDDAMAATDHAFGKDAEVGVMRRNFSGSECGTEFWCANLHKDAELVLSAWGSTGPRALCNLIIAPSRHRTASEIAAEVRPNVEGKTLEPKRGALWDRVAEAVPVVSVCGGKSVAPIPAGKFDSTFREVEEARIRQIAREELAASGTAKVQRFMESLLECEHCKGAFSCLWPVKLTTTGETLKLCRKCSKKSADELRPASPGPETPLPPDPIRTFFNHHLGD